tara:strand:+ start:2777 stop:3916 length:1140 start_codon:yes stop_codon:yes gene_type:complete
MKYIYLITNSSLNNTISNTLWLKNNKTENNFYIILNFQKYNKKDISYINKIYRKNISSDNYYLFNFWSKLQKIVGFFYLFSFIISFKIYDLLFPKKHLKLTIVQPRYRWLSERFKFLGKLIPSFDTILIGDGLSSECLIDCPPWIKDSLVSYTRLGVENLIGSFYLYSIYGNKNKNIYSKRFSKAELRNALKDIEEVLILEDKFKKIYSMINKIKRNHRKIFIFATSTFWEYKRLSLESEIELYSVTLKSILSKYNYEKTKDFILFKFHPRTNYKKIRCLKNVIKSTIDIRYLTDQYQEKLLLEFPLELLLLNLIDKDEVIINGISTGIIASSYIYNNLKIELGFGEKLVSKYFLKQDLIDNRLKQEKLISKLLKEEPI